jgi:hypothetical protein
VTGTVYEDAQLMTEDVERNLGEQPIARIMAEQGLRPHDLVAASTQQITHKMVARACKGRRLTANVQAKILNALNASTGKRYALGDLFNYGNLLQAQQSPEPGTLKRRGPAV